MRRPAPLGLALAVALALAGLAGCASSPGEPCPGELLAALRVEGVRDDAGTGCVSPPDGGWSAPAALAPFDATFRWDAETGTLAYCAGGPHAAVLRGTRDGDHLRAAVTVPGAVLGRCAATCLPLMTVEIEGDLSGGGGAPLAFAGTLTETFDGGAGPCGACQLPCASRYAVTGTER